MRLMLLSLLIFLIFLLFFFLRVRVTYHAKDVFLSWNVKNINFELILAYVSAKKPLKAKSIFWTSPASECYLCSGCLFIERMGSVLLSSTFSSQKVISSSFPAIRHDTLYCGHTLSLTALPIPPQIITQYLTKKSGLDIVPSYLYSGF